MGSPVIFNGVYGKLLASGGLKQKNNVLLTSGSGSPETFVTAIVGSIYTNTSNGDVYAKTSGTGNTGWVLVTAGGGGGSVDYPNQNILIVDPTLTADGVRIFNTIVAARTYALTLTPSATNPFQVLVAGGQFADGIIITPYIAYQLQPNTRIDGAVTSVFGFADVAAADYSFIEGGNLTNVTGTAGAFFTFFNNSVISGGIGVASIFVFNKCSIRYIDLSAVGLTAIALGDCYISSGEFRRLSATRATFNNNFGGSGVNIQLGTFIQCSFETATIQDITGTLSFFDCFFSQTAVTWPTFVNASVNMIGCVTNNEQVITFNGASPNIWKENVNLKYNNENETFYPNEFLSSGGVAYFRTQIGFTQLATLAGASLTYSGTVKAYVPISRIKNVAALVTGQFAATGLTALTLDIGYTGAPTAYLTGFDILQAPTANSFADVAINAIQSIGASTDILITVTAVGANLDTLSGGVLDIHMNYEEELLA